MRFLFLILLCFFCFSTAQAKPLVADLSSRLVEIDTGFNGTELLLFGARNDPGDVVVIVRGPYHSYMVRRKERVAGVWVNREQVRFDDIASFYSVSSSRPLDFVRNNNLLSSLDVGMAQLHDTLQSRAEEPDSNPQFATALLDYKLRNRLYTENLTGVDFIGETLFRTLITIPENIIRGRYVAEVYLFSDGQLVGVQTTPILVKKTGLDARIFDMAYKHPFFYGIMAVLMALSSGWLAGAWFNR